MLYVLLILILFKVKSIIAVVTMDRGYVQGKMVPFILGRAMLHAQATATIAFFVRPECALLLGLFDFLARGLNETLVVRTQFVHGCMDQTISIRDARWFTFDTIINVFILGVLLAR